MYMCVCVRACVLASLSRSLYIYVCVCVSWNGRSFGLGEFIYMCIDIDR